MLSPLISTCDLNFLKNLIITFISSLLGIEEVLMLLKCMTFDKFNILIAVMSVCQQEISIWSIISYLTCISDNFTHNVVCRCVTGGGSSRDSSKWIIEIEGEGGLILHKHRTLSREETTSTSHVQICFESPAAETDWEWMVLQFNSGIDIKSQTHANFIQFGESQRSMHAIEY